MLKLKHESPFASIVEELTSCLQYKLNDLAKSKNLNIIIKYSLV